MLYKITKSCLFLALLLLPFSVDAQSASFEQNSFSVETGDVIDIQINADGMESLYSADFNLVYDSQLLEYQTLEMGDFTDPLSPWILAPDLNDLGRGMKELEVSVPIESYYFDGVTGELASASFLVLPGSGETQINMTYFNVFFEDDEQTPEDERLISVSANPASSVNLSFPLLSELFFDQIDYELKAMDNFSLVLNAANLDEVNGIEFAIQYDPRVINYKAINVAPLMEPLDMFQGLSEATQAIDEDTEELQVSIYTDFFNSVSGSGELASLAFQAGPVSGSTNVEIVKFNIIPYDTFAPEFLGESGSSANIIISKSEIIDEQAPKIAISDPATKGVYVYENESNIITISGTSTDNILVNEVSYELDTGDSGQVIGTSTWSAEVELVEGLNEAVFTVSDLAGNTASTSLVIDYVVLAPRVPEISFRNTSYKIEPGANFDIIIDVADLNEAEAVAFTLQFDPKHISYEGLSILSLMEPIDPFETVEETGFIGEDKQELYLKIYTEIFNSISGSGELVSLEFLATSTEETSIMDFSGFTVFPADIFQDPIEGKLGSSTLIVTGFPDTEAPLISDMYPSSVLAYDAIEAEIGFLTNEAADCYYSDQASTSIVAYSPMDLTSSTSHSTVVSGLEAGNSYSFYFICEDESGNRNLEAEKLSFELETAPIAPDTPVSSGGSGGGGGSIPVYLLPVISEANKSNETNGEDEDIEVLGIEYIYGGEKNEKLKEEVHVLMAKSQAGKLPEKYSKILAKSNLSDLANVALYNFVNEGTKTTNVLGAGERAGVLESYYLAFGKYPETEEEWLDLLKIANGKWPGEVLDISEMIEAIERFKSIYKRDFDENNEYDRSAMMLMHYGLRPNIRSMDKERWAIEYFRQIFDRDPQDTMDWNTIRAIAYSGAKR